MVYKGLLQLILDLTLDMCNGLAVRTVAIKAW